jgi:uncharacterized protein DUF4398
VRRLLPRTTRITLLSPRTTRITLILTVLLLVVTGCSEPPQKEIDQAQAALELARTAGANRFAPDEYNAAAAGLQKARDAVTQRDYRQALSYAIDARQRAQDALSQVAEGKKRAQRAVEALYGEVATRANRLQTLLRAAEAAHVKPKELRAPRATLAEARKALQEASAAITLGNYEQGSKSLTEVRGKLDAAIRDVQSIPLHPVRAERAKAPKSSAPRREPPPSL